MIELLLLGTLAMVTLNAALTAWLAREVERVAVGLNAQIAHIERRIGDHETDPGR